MRQAVVQNKLATVYTQPSAASIVLEEVLPGHPVRVLEAGDDWARVLVASGAEGYLQNTCLCQNAGVASQWAAYGKMAVRAPWLDVLEEPDSKAPRAAQLPRGALVHPLDDTAPQGGWLAVGLPDGRRGWAKQSQLMPQALRFATQNAVAQREALATSALSYLGTPYRWGGRSPLGLDSAGLVSMACLFSGILFTRATRFEADALFHPVRQGALEMGDVILFGGHCALYIGEDKYVHATSQDGSDGVVINSLDPASPFYRADLAARLSGCGSVF